MKPYLALVAAVLAVTACANDVPAGTGGAALTATLWELVGWPGHDIPRGDNGAPVVLNFQDDGNQASVSGRSWCNQFGAPYVLREGSRLTIGHAASTRMACHGKAMQFEAAFLDKLQALERYRINGTTLELFAADGEVMTLRARSRPAGEAGAAPAAPAAPVPATPKQ